MPKTTKLYNFKPDWAMIPGEIIQDFMSDRNWSNRELALRLDLHENTVGKILKGEDRISTEIADRMARIFGMKASFFINLQTLYDESLPRQIKKEEQELASKIPYLELSKLGWVPSSAKIEEKLQNLYGFFGISSLANLGKIGAGAIAFRKRETNTFSKEALACWLRKGEIEAVGRDLPKFNQEKLNSKLEEIKKLSKQPFLEIKSDLHSILGDSGVILNCTPKLTNSCVNGASRWFGENILIQVSDTGKKEDIFWFTLFHELGHTLKHLANKKKLDFIDLEESQEDIYEKEADEFSKNTLIANQEYNLFVKSKDFSEASLVDFASQNNIGVGILVGRMCKDEVLSFAEVSKFRRKLEF